MEVRKAELTGMLLYHPFTTDVEWKCFRQHIRWAVMSTLNHHEMGQEKITMFCQMFNIFKPKVK